MKKSIILVMALIVSAMAFAERDYKTLKALSFGVGLPFEMRDLPGAGLTANIGYDCAYPVNDHFAMGFYLTGGGALLRGLDKRLYDKIQIPFHIADDPLHSVARGAGIALKNPNRDNLPFLMR